MRASGLLSSLWAYPANKNSKVTSDLGPSHSATLLPKVFYGSLPAHAEDQLQSFLYYPLERLPGSINIRVNTIQG